MNNLLLLGKIKKVIDEKPMEYQAYEDFYGICRAIMADEQAVGTVTVSVANLKWLSETISGRIPTLVQMDLDLGRKLMGLHRRVLIAAAHDDFDSFMLALEFNRPVDQQFWKPRRRHLMPICQALQDLEHDKLDELFLSCPPRIGKALSDDTPILTRNGWKNHGDLVVGDEVIGLNGEFKKVIAVHPKCMLDVLVEFTNGASFQCHENHEWLLYDRARMKNVLLETWQYESVKPDSGTPGHRGHRYRFQLPKHEYVQGEYKDLALDPYTFGVWLGDGANRDPRIANIDSDYGIIQRIIDNGHQIRWQTRHKTTGVMYYDFDIRKQLKSMGMCNNHKRLPKHIPDEYLTASVEQRLELLAGLIDTDGTFTRKENRYHFATCDIELRDSFIQLVSTFGWRINICEHKPSLSSSGVQGRKSTYQISFCPDCIIPCELERKRNTEFALRRAVALKSIRRVEPKRGNCITVEGDGMYLAGHMLVPTHNTATINMFVIWVILRNSERSNLYSSFTSLPVDTFYEGLLEILKDPATYDLSSIFPARSVVGTNAKETTLDIDRRKKYHSFTGRPIGGSLNGSCDCNGYIIGDDLCSGIEEAMSKERMASLWYKVENNFITRAKENCKRLWIGTRWSMVDPQGIRLDLLRNEPKYANVRWRYINTPALDENDQSNFDYQFGVGFSTEYYQMRRASFERNNDMASWLAQYQGEPIERDGSVFNPDDLRYYNGTLPDADPDRVFMAVDPAWGGGDFVSAPIIYQYGDDLFVADVVYNNGDKRITQPLLVQKAIEHNVQAIFIEATRTTASYTQEVDALLASMGHRVNLQSTTKHYTGTGKEQRIFDRAPEIREMMVFLESGKRHKEYEMFMQNLFSFSIARKNKNDDAPDSCAIALSMAIFGGTNKVQVIKRPF